MLRIIVIAFLTAVSFLGAAGVNAPKGIGIENGLSHNSVTSICRDSYGYTWIGTRYGLNIYDNTRVTNIFADPGTPGALPSDDIIAVFEDARRDLWVITDMGAAIYDRVKRCFNPVTLNGLPVSGIRSFCLRDDGVMLGGQGIIYIYRYADSSLAAADVSGGSAESYISIVPWRTGRFAMATRNDGVWVYDVMSRSVTQIINGRGTGPDGAPVSDIAVDRQGNLWIATCGNGASCFGSKATPLVWLRKADGSLASDDVNGIMIAGDNLLFATGKGISQWSASGDRTPMAWHGLAGRNVTCLYSDNFGNRYAGTADYGAVALALPPVISVRAPSISDPVRFVAFTSGEAGTVWCGGTAGVFRFTTDDPALTPVPVDGLDKVTSLLAADGRVIVGATPLPSFVVFDGSSLLQHRTPAVLHRLAEMHRGRDISFDMIRISHDMVAAVSDTVYFMNCDRGIPSSVISAVASPHGKLKPIGIYGGSVLLRGEDAIFQALPGRNWLEQLSESSNGSAPISAAAYDNRNRIFYVQNGELLIYELNSDNIRPHSYTPEENIDALICDGDRLWVAYPRRIVLVDSARRWQFDSHNGFAPDRLIDNASLVTSAGIIAGGINGVTYINRSEISSLTALDPIVTDIMLDQVRADGTDITDRIRDGRLQVSSDVSDITLSFIESSRDPRREKRFLCYIGDPYKVTGHEVSGHTVHIRPRYGEECSVSFACSLPDGSWSDPVTVLTLSVSWPWWVRLLLASVILGIVATLVTMIMRWRQTIPDGGEIPQGIPDQTSAQPDVRDWKERIDEAIEEGLADPEFGVTDLMEITGIGRTRLHERIKQATGMSAGAYIIDRRIRRAQELLADPALSVTDIATMTGCRTQRYFSSLFKEKTGLTPSQWRKKASE